MWSAFEEELGKSVADRLAEYFFSPAALFGLGIAIAWGIIHYGSLPAALDAWQAQPLQAQAAGLFLWAVAVVVLSAIMGAVRDAWLRLLEGYGWPGFLRRWRAKAWQRRAQQWKRTWQALKAHEMDGVTPLTPTERVQLHQLEARLHHLPPRDEEIMPTRLGNVLAAAEAAVRHRYGLDPIVAWPHLWMQLPDPAREALAQTRQRLDQAAEGVLWGLLFAGVGGPWDWWAVPLGLFAAWLAYRLAVARAAVFGDLVRAAFDLHRLSLYEALGWPKPTPEQEVEAGQRLTRFLWRGQR